MVSQIKQLTQKKQGIILAISSLIAHLYMVEGANLFNTLLCHYVARTYKLMVKLLS